MYAVVAPGFSNVYSSWYDVERIKKLYPYPKFCKVRNEAEAYEWIRRNSYGTGLSRVYNYGDTFSDLYIYVTYKIGPDCVYYVLDTSRIGNIRIHSSEALIEYKGDKIYIKYPNLFITNESIAGHMSIVYNLLILVGDYIDVNIELPYYSIFYALTSYSKGKCRSIQVVQDLISARLGAVAYSLKMENFSDEEISSFASDDYKGYW